jgi:cellulose synthase/poly-beta-1,6-N-acetylglucosamine synthase-like glycosyltransferase
MNDIDPTQLLLQLDARAAFAMFWPVLLLDIPRYTMGFLVVLVGEVLRPARSTSPEDFAPLVSVVLAGHNERHAVARCVRSLREQSYAHMEIICVDDGSTDGMMRELTRLRSQRLIDIAVATNIRSGKSAAGNLGLSLAKGEVVLITDCDCSFDRDAVARLVAPLADPRVAGVTGNIAARNAQANMLTGLQAVEYLVGICLGRRVLDMLGQITCASGAFSAFRRATLQQLGGLDTGAGEDLDLTLRMRRAGWQVRFAADAWCLTDVPYRFPRFLRQRLRWERDSLRLRMRKHGQGLDPTDYGTPIGELLHRIEYLVTHIIPTLAFPLYLIWLVSSFGTAAITILTLVTMMYLALDGIAALCALAMVGRPGSSKLLPYVVCFGLFQAYLVRSIRLVAYVQEWVFRSSYRDNFVPRRVLDRAPWH